MNATQITTRFAVSALVAVCLATLTMCTLCANAEAQPPRNVVLLIGDGMGPEQVKAANYYQGGPLSFETMPFQAEVTTYSANSSVTDSGASATALATGVKVNNSVISMAIPGDERELTTLLEYLGDLGRSTGLVTTTYMTHATPAAFGAHEPSRNYTSNIAVDYLNQTRPDVLLGGGGNGMSAAAAADAGYSLVTTASTMPDTVTTYPETSKKRLSSPMQPKMCLTGPLAVQTP